MAKKTEKRGIIRLTYEWDISETEWEENKEFLKQQGFVWDGDPVTLFHFLNQIVWPSIHRKTVERVS